MDPRHFTTLAHKFQSVLDEEVLNERGQAIGLVKRKRLITPFRMGLSVIASMGLDHGIGHLASMSLQKNQ